MHGRRAGLTVLVLMFALLAPASASADRAFSPRFSQSTQGDIAIAANNLLSCASSEAVCPAARAGTLTNLTQANNNARVMTYVDVDGDSGTFNSSDADLALPPGARVLFAGLYYGGRLAAGTGGRPAPTPGAAGTALLQAPGDTGYQALPTVGLDTAGDTYQAFHDVTDIVAAAGAGTYRVANVQAGVGRSDGQLAGWSLVVAYGDPAAPSRNLSVFDGLQNVGSASPPVAIPLAGFLTPATGPVNSTVGIIAYEGDIGTTGDGASIVGAGGAVVPLGSATPGSPPLNATNNIFDSSISAGGASVTSRTPADRNTLGFDADLFPLPGVLGNNQSSTSITLTTRGDAYQPGVVTIATDLFAPRIVATKSVDQAEADLGDTLTYTLSVQNTGADGAEDVVVSDAIPDGTTYVSGSLRVDGAVVTDATGDDVGEVAGGALTARLGTGANGSAGGTLAPGSVSRTVTFQVTVDTVVPPPATVENVARVDFSAQTTGEVDAGVETAPAVTQVRSPTVNLVTTKSVFSVPRPGPPGFDDVTYQPDDSIGFRITVTNEGALPAPNVVVTDTLPAPMRFLGAYVVDPFQLCAGPTTPPSPPPVPLQCNVGTLAPGATVTIEVGGVLPNDANLYPPTATLTNEAVATSGGVETNPDDNAATAAIRTYPISDVYVQKVFAPAQPLEGGRVIYTMTVGNRGPSVADVSFADLLPAQISFDTIEVGGGTGDCEFGELPEAPGVPLGLCTIPQMEVGGERVITLIGTLKPGTRGQAVSNLAAVTPNGLERDDTRGDDLASVAFTARYVDLSVEKTRVETGEFPVGTETTFRLTVRNGGDAPATGVVVTDTLPAGLTPLGTGPECSTAGQVVSCTAGDLAPGAEQTFDVRARAEASAAGTTVTNTAAVSADTPDAEVGNDVATLEVPIGPVADLAVEKTRVGAGELRPGDEATFRLTVRNAGPGTAVNAQVGDLLPDGLTPVSAPPECTTSGQLVVCAAGDLAPGAEHSVDLVVRVDAGTAGSTLVNLGGVTSDTQDVAPGNDLVELAVPIGEPSPPPPPTPTPEPPPAPQTAPQVFPQVDVALRVIGPDGTVRAGEPSRWRIEVTNVSQVTATGVTVSGSATGAALGTTARVSQAACGPAPPDGCALGTLAAGETRTVDVTLTPQRTGTLTLAGSTRAAEPETRTDNNADQATVDVEEGRTDVAVRVAAADTRLEAGERVPLRVVVRNRGARTALGARVCVRLPRGLTAVRRGRFEIRSVRLCATLAPLPAGARRTLPLRVRATCLAGRRDVRATVRGANLRTRRARLPIRIACAPPRPEFTG